MKCPQVPDANKGIDTIDAVLVDEEAVGSVDGPGCGAKILHGHGALEKFLHEIETVEPTVCFPSTLKFRILPICFSILFPFVIFYVSFEIKMKSALSIVVNELKREKIRELMTFGRGLELPSCIVSRIMPVVSSQIGMLSKSNLISAWN